MPWVAVEQIAKLLKVGGHVFVETHFSFGAHGRPWNFFQFSDMGLRALFNPALGFEVIEAGMSNPIAGYFTAGPRPICVTSRSGNSTATARSVPRDARASDFAWSRLGADDVAAATRYPKPR